MADRAGPRVYSIAAHRGFADALVAGLIPRYAEADLGLARLTLLLPSRRAVRTVTEAFIRLSGAGLLLPRMAVVGDLDLDEALGPLLDPLGAGAEIPPAADPTRRWLRLAAHLKAEIGDETPNGATLLRLARDAAGTMDRLLVEGIDPDDLMSETVLGIVGEQAGHWQTNTRLFLRVQARWLAELSERGEVDAPARRNLLFEHAARRWHQHPPEHPIVAAGVTSASPALARLLRVVADMPQGAVILPDLDLALDSAVWDELGTAGKPAAAGDPPFGKGDAFGHPQYHLKLLLNRMGVMREEVQPWHRAGLAAAPPDRSRAISNLFLPAQASAGWVSLPASERRLDGVRIMETAHPEHEAQAIAILLRETLELPERRAALITPDRGLAARVVAQLERWGVKADDTAGQPLPQTAAGRVLLLLAELIAESAAPVPLLALLTHPLVRADDRRAAWLEQARRLDLALRGPRPDAGLDAISPKAEKAGIAEWWQEASGILVPVMALTGDVPLAAMLDVLAKASEELCGERLWSGADGRALATLVDELREGARAAGTQLDARDLHAVLHDCLDRVSVRPPWGGHPRIAVYGLLEARMVRADLVVCAGLTEGVWPASATPDAMLPPAVLRALGVPGAEFRIGLSAHDLAAALGAPEVVLSFARRDSAGPVNPSRFVLRIKALLGELGEGHVERRAAELALAIDDPPPAAPFPRPQPRPSAQQRLVDISVTGLDRLRSDPFQFYASAILHLRSLDGLDVQPSAAWKGTAVHEILETWHKAGAPTGELTALAARELDAMSAHPLMRALWRPRLLAALGWIDTELVRLAQEQGRKVAESEIWGDMTFDGVRIHGRADRIDRLADGTLAIVDYKTGSPPKPKAVKEGYSLQLGLIGLIAASGGFKGISGVPENFEYWSLAKARKQREDAGFGFVSEPFRTARADGIEKADFLQETRRFLAEAIGRWIKGNEPFTARLNLDVASYADYDQLMRLDEWLTRLPGAGEDGQ